jgi:rare lipoprotein A|tara:strand:+ start:1062 stop:2003 length:942 start_codon:yes stop_codon:yes gene_type:complete
MKLIISLLLFLIISCEQISKDEVINTIENTKDVIVEKTIKSPDTTEKIDLKVEEDKVNKNKIFYLIGEPYYIEGVKYVPEENYSYEEIGLATFYDKELHNKRTANNDLNKVTELLGRHKTLPLPSIVKITNLENGLSLTIKIIDRHDDNTSIIQVSRKVAQLLRFYKNKITKTKVEILPDPSRQWKNVTMSINDKDFNNTVESAPTEIVSISNIDEDLNTAEDQNEDINIEQPIELGFEEVDDLDLYLHVNNFKNYQEIKNIVNEINLSDKYTSENIGNFYKLIVGPIDNKTADKLLSTFISKGYKESKLILN